jgi:hypothetical protein
VVVTVADPFSGPDEYFYKKPTSRSRSQPTTAKSSNSSMGTNEDRLGEPDEFDRMIERYRQKQRQP